jgi:hypothetical protein
MAKVSLLNKTQEDRGPFSSGFNGPWLQFEIRQFADPGCSVYPGSQILIFFHPGSPGSINKKEEGENNYLCTYDLYSPAHNDFDACISILGQVALEFESFLGPVKWHRAKGEFHFGPKKREFQGPTPSHLP